MLTYRRTNSLNVVGYSDTDFKGCVDDKKSTTGYIFAMARGTVSWWSAKQSVTASLTMEAKYVACYEATRHAIWLWNFIGDLGVVNKPIIMYCDNTAVVSFSNNLKGTPSARYIDVKYFLVKEKVEEDLITVVHMPTYSMVADPLTKALSVYLRSIFHVKPQKYPRIFIIILLYIPGINRTKLGFFWEFVKCYMIV